MNKIIYSIAKLLPVKKSISDLEKISTKDILEFNEMGVVPAFHNIAKRLPFYKKILEERGVNPSSIKNIEDFKKFVPVIEKKDIFPKYNAKDLCMDGKIDDVRSAIVTSGTSGKFAYGMLTEKDSIFQKEMIDSMFDYQFNVKKENPLIINALSMGVTFSSGYPVITTGIRSDIALHLIKTLAPYYKQIIVVTMPNLATKIIDEAEEFGVDWGKTKISFVVGGMATSSSLIQYLIAKLNPVGGVCKNNLLGTMGMTELGLNLFSTTSYLFELRKILQENEDFKNELFGENNHRNLCPEIMHYFPLSYYFEILNEDKYGYGDIVITCIDIKSKTPLIRYNTGDVGKFLDKKKVEDLLIKYGYKDLKLKMNLPLIAIGGRAKDGQDDTGSLVPGVYDAIYRDHEVANLITGHFKIIHNEGIFTVNVQLKKNKEISVELKEKLNKILNEVLEKDVEVQCMTYCDYPFDMELNYENKWKHF